MDVNLSRWDAGTEMHDLAFMGISILASTGLNHDSTVRKLNLFIILDEKHTSLVAVCNPPSPFILHQLGDLYPGTKKDHFMGIFLQKHLPCRTGKKEIEIFPVHMILIDRLVTSVHGNPTLGIEVPEDELPPVKVRQDVTPQVVLYDPIQGAQGIAG
jgi:hypothetical protein